MSNLHLENWEIEINLLEFTMNSLEMAQSYNALESHLDLALMYEDDPIAYYLNQNFLHLLIL